jgi:Effector-associated domain 2/Domain of unknown function (DUF4062)
MTTNHPLSLFVSSKMEELAKERKAVQAALSDYNIYGWLWENDAGARPFTLRSTYLKEVEICDIYIGLFWLGYSSYVIEEYEYACTLNKQCLIYEKHVNIENRDLQLMQFLKHIEKMNSADSPAVRRFTDTEELADLVQQDAIRLLTGIFRESRDQPTAQLPVIDQQGETLGRTLTIMEQVELTDKLLNCGAISDQSQRESVLDMLPTDLKQRIIRGNTDITDVLQIIKKSTEYNGGLEKLLMATRSVEGDTRSVRAVVAYLHKLGFPLF